MKRCVLAAVSCFFLALLIPAVLLRYCAPAADEPAPRLDERRRVSVLLPDGTVTETSLAELLNGVLSAEMPADFPEEALRAQAVASRSYVLYSMEHHRHGEADVCCSGACCQAFADADALRERWGADYDVNAVRIAGAVTDTDGMALYWADEPILACFHAASPGATESSERVWREALPYLRSVSSPETAENVANLVSVREIYPEEFRAAVRESCPAAALDTAAGEWISGIGRDASGRVAQVIIGGVPVPGTELRSIFSLRSTAFDLEWTGEVFRFTVSGSGHGVGLSQQGARLMAGQGCTWQEILAHYYPGTELRRAEG